MSHMRFRAVPRNVLHTVPDAAPLLRRSRPVVRPLLPSVSQVVLASQPSVPLYCRRPGDLVAAAHDFVSLFQGGALANGRVLYAVKCNPDRSVLRSLWLGGVRHFDCASAQEVRLVRGLFPDAHIHFMHPVKSRPAIAEAWGQHGVRDFVIDSAEELDKVLAEIGGASADLGLVVRLGLPKGNAVYDLSGKFGADADLAARLLVRARAVSGRVGLCFHVGSQCLDPTAWDRALVMAGQVIDQSGVAIDMLDVGGGFPVSYPGVTPPPLEDFINAIRGGIARLNLSAETEIWCEPGRALVAGGQSIVVRVEGRRGDHLFINDGVYGGLSDAGVPAFRFPCRMIRADGAESSAPMMAFAFFGPTCDSADRMAGPFYLPADIHEGDWIEIGQLGAYGQCLRTAFNGFDQIRVQDVRDQAMLETPRRRSAANEN